MIRTDVAAAELLQGRYFSAFRASLPCGLTVLYPADTARRLEGCGEDLLVPGLAVEADGHGWEDAIAEWMIAGEGRVELARSAVVRLALERCGEAADDAEPSAWACDWVRPMGRALD